jgi:tetratricopeptide (TPR) repeat protein
MKVANSNVESPEPGQESPSRSKRSPKRLALFRLLFIALGLSPFILLEVGLRIFDVGESKESQDPFAGFNARNPLFEKQGDVFRTSRFRGQYFNPQEFQAVKPDNQFRIFCLGGSTVYGQPFHEPTAFPKWLELELNERQSDKDVKVVNCGGISYASHRLLHVAREVAQYQPDLIVLATGHNEFLEDRTYYSLKSQSTTEQLARQGILSLRTVALVRRWLGKDQAPDLAPASETRSAPAKVEDVHTRLDERTGYASFKRDPEWHARVIAEFARMVREIALVCDSASTPLILVNLGSNLRDCPPLKSGHKEPFTIEEERQWRRAFDQADALEATDLKAALDAYREAESIDPDYALLQYRMARVFDRLGDFDAARDYYLRSKAADICPLRMFDRLNEVQFQIAKETGTPIVDYRNEIEKLSPGGIPGFDWYVDHVHPGIGGHQRMAGIIAPVIGREKLLPIHSDWPQAERRAAYAKHIDSLPGNYLTNGGRRVEWLDAWANRQRLLLETVPRDAPGYVRQGMRRYEFANEDGAWESFTSALRLNPNSTSALIGYARELHGQGRTAHARKLIDRLAATPQANAPALELETLRATLAKP